LDRHIPSMEVYDLSSRFDVQIIKWGLHRV
jgi:hypothetical protein